MRPLNHLGLHLGRMHFLRPYEVAVLRR